MGSARWPRNSTSATYPRPSDGYFWPGTRRWTPSETDVAASCISMMMRCQSWWRWRYCVPRSKRVGRMAVVDRLVEFGDWRPAARRRPGARVGLSGQHQGDKSVLGRPAERHRPGPLLPGGARSVDKSNASIVRPLRPVRLPRVRRPAARYGPALPAHGHLAAEVEPLLAELSGATSSPVTSVAVYTTAAW